jgi:hypothetical protein
MQRAGVHLGLKNRLNGLEAFGGSCKKSSFLEVGAKFEFSKRNRAEIAYQLYS